MFDIKRLSTAFVLVTAILTTGKTIADDALETVTAHEKQVVRAGNIFYNLFVTNALQAGRVTTSGSVSAGSLYVQGKTVGTGANDGALTVAGAFTQNSENVSINDTVYEAK